MKLILAYILLVQSVAFSAETDKYNQLSIDKSMEQLLEIEGVDKIYKGCVSSFAESTDLPDYSTKISSCLWSGVQKDEKLKAQVTQAHADLKKKEDENKDKNKDDESSRSPSSETQKSLVAKKLNVTVSTKEDPAVKALSEFYSKKLDAVLNPQTALTKAERDAGTVAIVDHRKYIELYKSALGKTIINAFTSYCMETGPACADPVKECTPDDPADCEKYTCLVPNTAEARESNKKANMLALTDGSIDLDKDSADSQKWTKCIQEVTPICTDSKHAYSKQRACVIVDYVKSARVNLQLTDEQITYYDKLDKDHQRVGMNQGFKLIGTDEEASADAISTITSKDISESLKPVEEKAMANMDQCFTSDENGENATIVDAEACKEFLNTNRQESTQALAEFELRQNIQADSLKVEIADDANLEKYLKDEGYTEAEIKNLLADPNSMKIVREKIISRFDNEKKALVAEMKKRIADNTTAAEGEVTQKDISKLQTIKNELKARSSDLAGAVQFNNIVSSYLDYKDNKSGETGRNVAGLFAEVGSMSEEEAKAFNDKIKDASLVDKKSTVELSLTNLNNIFLGYIKSDDKK